MPVAIVDFIELIDIDKNNRGRVALPVGTGLNRHKQFFKMPAITKSC